MPAPKRQQGQSISKHDEAIDDYIASLEADCTALAMAYLGISPDRNTQTVAEVEAAEKRLRKIARSHNPYTAR